ncbi:MAG: exodeoxyribonuclease VII small subunit [Candidatus Pacebacteria bacterium]|nr:exodeoxyribonuclease VII small subunit [Candidatus Paceibacterota bacterium]MDD4333568.1 exodeoxyribonuclease VII small subunit [Candidatus Paceibacterota bacterium]
MTQKENKNLEEMISSLSSISDWFQNQKEIDIELGLKKVKEATSLIKEAKKRLAEVENEFEEIKKDL